jgi:hypothetical protein
MQDFYVICRVIWNAAGYRRLQVITGQPVLCARWGRLHDDDQADTLCILMRGCMTLHSLSGSKQVVPLPQEYSDVHPLPQGILLTVRWMQVTECMTVCMQRRCQILQSINNTIPAFCCDVLQNHTWRVVSSRAFASKWNRKKCAHLTLLLSLAVLAGFANGCAKLSEPPT